MKKFYLYKFTMETPIGNLPKSEISNYSVTNLDHFQDGMNHNQPINTVSPTIEYLKEILQ